MRVKVGSSYQPPQSVLKPHPGHRQTACIRYISAFQQRSQIIRSSFTTGFWGLTTEAGTDGDFGKSDMRGIIANAFHYSSSVWKSYILSEFWPSKLEPY